MKSITESFLALVGIVIISALGIVAQKPQRIQFEKGKSSAVIKASTGQHGVTYVLRARSGQKLVLHLTPASKVGIKVETMDRFGEMVLLEVESGGRYEVGLEETGDYTIFIGSLGERPVSFTLAVEIRKLADI